MMSIVHRDVTDALVAWQATGDERSLERLIKTTLHDLQGIAARRLVRLRIRDSSAVDDTLSLVFDHVRRLAAANCGGRPATPFDDRGDTSGFAYLVWLVERRAGDVARARRRLSNRARTFSDLDDGPIVLGRLMTWADGGDEAAARLAKAHDAIAKLEPQLRAVVDMLLAGKSQATIAHVLDVCEGTVSRLKVRALAELRRMVE